EANVDATHAAVRWGTDFAKQADLVLRAEGSGAREGDAFVLRRAALQLGDGRLDVAGTMQPGMVDVPLDSNRAPLAPLAASIPAMAGTEMGGTAEAHLTARGAIRRDTVPALAGTVALADVSLRRPGVPEMSGLTTTLAVGDGLIPMPTSGVPLRDGPAAAGGTVSLAERLLTGERASAQLFGGTTEATGHLDLQDRHRPRFAIEDTVHDVALGRLLEARAPDLAAHVDGRLDASASLTGAGKGPEAVR